MNDLIKRYLTFTFGLYVLTLGVVMIIKSSLGTSPISSFTYVLSLHTPLTIGMATILLNLFLVAGEFWFIRDRLNRKDVFEILMQLPFSLLFGMFIDLNMWLLAGVAPSGYMLCMGLLVAGCMIQATGVVLEIKPNVVKMSAEGFVSYASLRYRKDFGRVKIVFDISLVLLAVATSFYFVRGVEGVREGTIVSSILVGTLVTLINRVAARFYAAKAHHEQ